MPVRWPHGLVMQPPTSTSASTNRRRTAGRRALGRRQSGSARRVSEHVCIAACSCLRTAGAGRCRWRRRRALCCATVGPRTKFRGPLHHLSFSCMASSRHQRRPRKKEPPEACLCFHRSIRPIAASRPAGFVASRTEGADGWMAGWMAWRQAGRRPAGSGTILPQEGSTTCTRTRRRAPVRSCPGAEMHVRAFPTICGLSSSAQRKFIARHT